MKKKAVDALLMLAVSDGEPDRHSLEREMAEFMDQHCYRPLKDVKLGRVPHSLMEITVRHRMGIPPDLFLMIKALSTVEGLGRALDPDFNVVEQATPFIRRIQMNRVHPRRIARELAETGADVVRFLKDVPGDVRKIMSLAGRGKVKMEFVHRGLDPLLSTYDKISNRLAFAIVLVSLVIGSSVIVLSDVPPKWNQVPVLGLIGFLVAGAMGFWLLISIIRSGRM